MLNQYHQVPAKNYSKSHNAQLSQLDLFAFCGEIPQFVCLLLKAALLLLVAFVPGKLGLGDYKHKIEVLSNLELFTQLSCDLSFEPCLIFGCRHSIADGGLVEFPEAGSYDNLVPPVFTEDYGHPLQHCLESFVELRHSAVQKQDDGVGMVDRVGEEVHHSFCQCSYLQTQEYQPPDIFERFNCNSCNAFFTPWNCKKLRRKYLTVTLEPRPSHRPTP